MMYGWSGWGMWLIGPVMMVAIVWLVVWLVRDTAAATALGTRPAGSRNILEERFARGEIDQDEYLARLATLERR
ncbi:MAG: SHOCT domain-containing protein [Acidimicrobiia bacterium]|nr:SHOCT domain-containing protein [Acidimicrobiia bacterium]